MSEDKTREALANAEMVLADFIRSMKRARSYNSAGSRDLAAAAIADLERHGLAVVTAEDAANAAALREALDMTDESGDVLAWTFYRSGGAIVAEENDHNLSGKGDTTLAAIADALGRQGRPR